MKQTIISLLIIFSFLEVFAEDSEEIKWVVDTEAGINDVLLSPLGDVFYNVKGQILQIRNVVDGQLVDEIHFLNVPNQIYDISITADGRYLALSGDNPYIIIYDLLLEREVKRLTVSVWEEEQVGSKKTYPAEKWINSSISPDGTKVTGIAISDYGVYKTNFVILDIGSEKVLYESRRMLYDGNVAKPDNFQWIGAEFTPDGKYILSQIDYNNYLGTELDTIYIHDANTFEVYDVVLNRYYESGLETMMNIYEPTFLFYGNNSESGYFTYNLDTKSIDKLAIDPSVGTFLFFRTSDYAIYGLGWDFYIYDYKNDKVIYEYDTLALARTTSLDDKILIGTLYSTIYGLNTSFAKTNIRETYGSETTISPNPTSGIVNIDLHCSSQNVNYSIVNVDGLEFKKNSSDIINDDNLQLDLTEYPPGVYFITVICENEKRTYKVVRG